MSNRLENLTIAGCQSLKTVYAGYNDLSQIQLSGLAALQNLNITGNKIQKLYVQDLPALCTLIAGDNHMTLLCLPP